MRYTIPNTEDQSLVDQEFDHLDWQIREGHLDEVLDTCSRILKEPNVLPLRASWVHLLMGTVDLVRENYEGALRHFNAIQVISAPLRPRVTASAARALIKFGRIEEARRYVEDVYIASPDSWRTWEVHGALQRVEGDEEGAWKSLLRASELNPRESSIILSLMAIGLKPERWRELAVALERHLAIEPLNVGFRVCLVSCFLNLGEIQRARDEAQRIVAFGAFRSVPADVLATMKQILNQLS